LCKDNKRYHVSLEDIPIVSGTDHSPSGHIFLPEPGLNGNQVISLEKKYPGQDERILLKAKIIIILSYILVLMR